jgi:hypothetical protein
VVKRERERERERERLGLKSFFGVSKPHKVSKMISYIINHRLDSFHRKLGVVG